jgi:hypothetical protein
MHENGGKRHRRETQCTTKDLCENIRIIRLKDSPSPSEAAPSGSAREIHKLNKDEMERDF